MHLPVNERESQWRLLTAYSVHLHDFQCVLDHHLSMHMNFRFWIGLVPRSSCLLHFSPLPFTSHFKQSCSRILCRTRNHPHVTPSQGFLTRASTLQNANGSACSRCHNNVASVSCSTQTPTQISNVVPTLTQLTFPGKTYVKLSVSMSVKERKPDIQCHQILVKRLVSGVQRQ